MKALKELREVMKSFSDSKGCDGKCDNLTTTVSEIKEKGNCDSVTVVADENKNAENKVNEEVVNASEVKEMGISTKDFSELVDVVKTIGNEVVAMKKQFAEEKEDKDEVKKDEETVEVPVSLLDEVRDALKEANDKVDEAVDDEPEGEEEVEEKEVNESCGKKNMSDEEISEEKFEEFAEKVTTCIEDLNGRLTELAEMQSKFVKQFSGVGDVTTDKSDVNELAEGSDKKDDEFVVEKTGKEEITEPEPKTETKIVTETKVEAPAVNPAPTVAPAANFSDRYKEMKNLFNF